ncbi:MULTISPECIES: hypothetical protein [Vibrio]|uniref:Uncharacterized protein n=2 Tax=Vibrio TaxID=662 RepID=A0A2N7JN25_VIBSP|nr:MULTISPECIES: hypothetical protein [Vibrio]OED67344.1 hypothetical protein A143_21630 [Vibrio splendidus ZS-139]TVU64528.1 hypothetical protein FQP88_06445 [Vibrio atlanticus]TVU79090.1 hypothetical protein FQP87_01345 [Vibrio tasmaniensis]MCF7502397.1 hypothetical protein [Vibrio sp. L3-7]PMM43353.1 hypothetical protein BCT54_00720 [Vibrio splendidus]
MKRKFWLPILVTLSVILMYGVMSGIMTRGAYQFKGSYDNVGSEMLTLELKNGRSKMRYVGYDIDGRVVQTKQFFGVFLRWGNHYYFYQLEQDQAHGQQTFNVKNLFIQHHNNKRSVMVSDQRGAYVTKDGKILELKGILYGRSLR